MRNAIVALVALGALAACKSQPAVDQSVAQVERVRANVSITAAGRTDSVLTVRRVAAADLVRTDATGRAVLALDGGGRYVLDHDSAVRVTGARAAALEAGRLWVAGGGEGGREEDTVLRVGEYALHLRGARASVERRGDRASVAVMSGEIAFESSARRGAVRAGETVDLRAGGTAAVETQRAFADWTGGLADDLPTSNSDAAGLGAVAARRPEEVGAPRWPMVMQRLDAHVVVRGDLAITTLDQTFFNPSGDTVEGLYTFHTPPGAVLQMFGVDRRGRTVEGVVRERQQAAAQYQAQVYRGSTHDPALLEWDAPGRYHARLYPIPPGATRRVRVRYSQWLNPDGQGRRVYRLPLASLETRVGELRADFDLEDARAAQVRAGAGARIEDGHLYITQSDVIPRADMVVELRGTPPEDASAVRVAAPAGDADRRGNYLRVAVRAPFDAAREPRDEGVDLVVVVDHSAATDALALRLSQAFVESLVNALDPRDNVLVLAGDVGTRPIGAPTAELRAATPENRRAITDALANDRLGGATDLGAMVAAAHAALRPGRNGAIVYVGDGNATVGEAQLPGLRQALARLSPRPRFYAVAVGEDPRLDMLHGLAEPAGFAARVARRGDVARTALDLVEHASRPLVRNFRVSLGPSVQTVYPTEGVDLPAGEPLVVIGRFTTEPPRSVTVRASWNGAEVSREWPLATRALDDGGDLRFRWANARLEHLLNRGESRPVIVELGTRYGLITPFTSLYVASEDEVSSLDERRARERAGARVASVSDLSIADFFPLVGCARSAPSAEPPQAQAGQASASTPAPTTLPHAPGATAPAATPEVSPPPPQPTMPQYAAPAPRIAANRPTSGTTTAAPTDPSSAYAARAEEAERAANAAATAATVGGLQQGQSQAIAGGGEQAEPTRDRAATVDEPARPMAITGSGYGYGASAGSARRRTVSRGGRSGASDALDDITTRTEVADVDEEQRNADGSSTRERASVGGLARLTGATVEGGLSSDAVRRVVVRNLTRVAACHRQGLAQEPGAGGRVVVRAQIGPSGSVESTDLVDNAVPVPSVGDCITGVIDSLSFPPPAGGAYANATLTFALRAPDDARSDEGNPSHAATPRTPVRCSDAAAVSLAERVPLWRERLASAHGAAAIAQVYRAAAGACELRAWADRVALLRMMVERAGSVDGQIALHRALASDAAARAWTRDVILRQLARSGELARAQELGLGRLDPDTMTVALGRAATPAQRLAVLGELARRYPDDLDLAMRLLDAAVEQRALEVARAAANTLRAHPQADARVRTAVGEALLAVGDEPEARRAFSEIVEFAPDDPQARRRLGDIALSHGWSDEAYRQFTMLAALDDAPDVLLRQAMAARMAGRLDEALRLAQRVAEQSSGDARGGVAETAAAWIGVELGLAARGLGAQPPGGGSAPATPNAIAPDALEALRARWRRSPAARSAGPVRAVLRWFHPDDGAELWVTAPGEPARRSDMIGSAIFLESTVLTEMPPAGGAPLALEVRRGTAARARGRVELLVIWDEGTERERIDRVELELTEARARYVFNAAPGALTDVTPPPPPAAATAPNAPAPVAGNRSGNQQAARGAR